MKSFAIAAAAIALIPTLVAGLTVNSPSNVVECQPFQFSWSGGTPPYFLSLIPGQGQNPIKQFPQQDGTSLTWNVDLPVGTNFNAALKDSSGSQAFSGQASIIAGSDTSCVNTAVQESGTGAAGASSTGGSASATTSGASGSSGSSKPSGSASSSSSSSSASSTGAATIGASVSTFGIAGIFGLVGAVLF